MFLFCSLRVKWPNRASPADLRKLPTRLRQRLRQSAEALAKADQEAQRRGRRGPPATVRKHDGWNENDIRRLFAYS
jgi:hypothetical protein